MNKSNIQNKTQTKTMQNLCETTVTYPDTPASGQTQSLLLTEQQCLRVGDDGARSATGAHCVSNGEVCWWP